MYKRQILDRTVQTLQYQLQQGAFTPENFEMSFEMASDLDAVNITCLLYTSDLYLDNFIPFSMNKLLLLQGLVVSKSGSRETVIEEMDTTKSTKGATA